MRIAFISTYPPMPCGIAEYTWYLVRELKRLDRDIDITIFCDKNAKNGIFKDDGILVVPSFIPRNSVVELLEKMRTYGPYDIVHIQHEYSIFPVDLDEFIIILKYLRKMDITKRIIATMHNVYHISKGREFIEYQIRFVDVLDKVIVHSVTQLYELIFQGISPSKIVLIPHGTPECSDIDRDKALELLNLENLKDKFIVFLPGFLRWDKGVDIVLKITKLVGALKKDIVFVLAGIPQESDNEYIQRSLEEVLSNDNIVYIPKYLSRHEMALLIKASDLVVLPYRDHIGHLGVSGVLHMAIACRKPVVCSYTPRLVECNMLAPEISIPIDSHNELAKLIVDIAENYDSYIEKLKKLWSYAEETSWSRIAQKHLELYRELIAS